MVDPAHWDGLPDGRTQTRADDLVAPVRDEAGLIASRSARAAVPVALRDLGTLMPSGQKSRLTRSGGYGAPGSGLVVTLNSRGLTPTMPSAAMRAATVPSLTATPASCRSPVTRGDP